MSVGLGKDRILGKDRLISSFFGNQSWKLVNMFSFNLSKTGHFRGHGVMTSSGGQGSGGGAGGRIAVHINDKDEFRGDLLSLGGQGTSGSFGGTGTVYVEEIKNGTTYTRLYLNNQFADPAIPFILNESNPRVDVKSRPDHNQADYAFEEVMLLGEVNSCFINFKSFDNTLVMYQFCQGCDT